MAEGSVLWITDLSGSTNQATAPHLMADNQFKLLVNVDQSEIGGISHRLGTELFLELIAGAGEVQGLGAYEKADGTRFLHMVEGGNLRVSDETNSQWDSQDTSEWATSSKVDMVNFINRHYLIGDAAGEYLKYATDSGAVSTVAGNIEGSYLAANGAYLMVVDPASQKAQWSAPAADTFDPADFATINGYATGVGSFGNGRPFVVFTANNYLIVDPANITTYEVRDFGCTSHRSIQNIRGYLIYLGRQGFQMLGYNDSFPTDISRMIKNEWSGDAIFNKINGTSWAVTAAGVIKDRYYCAVRDLSANVKGYDLDNVLVEIDPAQQTAKCHTFTTGGLATVMAAFVDKNGDLGMYAGSMDNKAVYKMNVAGVYTDDDSAGAPQTVTSRIVTKDYAFWNVNSGVVQMQNVVGLHFRYQADSAITIKYSVDGDTSYDSFPVTLPVTAAGKAWEWNELTFGKECKTISLDLSCDGKFTLYGFGFEVDPTGSTGIQLR